MALLPNADRAVISRDKLSDYVLNPRHPTGAHKARVFASALGLSPADIDELYEAIHVAALQEPAVPGRLDQYGQRYVVDFVMRRAGREAMVRSTWIVRLDETFPRLTSCFVL